jgi:hypothetical protein
LGWPAVAVDADRSVVGTLAKTMATTAAQVLHASKYAMPGFMARQYTARPRALGDCGKLWRHAHDHR